MNYRHEARTCLDAAKCELATGDDSRLKYAALELRMSMEALTYDRALAFKDEFPPAEYQTWQPRKIMSVLLEIDPSADADGSLAVGIEQEYGVPSPAMQAMGTECVLGMAALREHYDALGSYLHLPSMKQAVAGKTIDVKKLRRRCEDLVVLVDKVLASPIFNLVVGIFTGMACLRCEKPIRKRVRDGEVAIAECFECHATYDLISTENDLINWHPKGQEVQCNAGDGCPGTIFLWESELVIGTHWQCETCGGRNTLVLALQSQPNSA